MSTFASIAKGHRSRRAVAFPLFGAKWDGESGSWGGETTLVDVRVLTPADELAAISAAAKRARDAGVVEPGDGDAIYDYALMVEKLVRACVDHDSPEDAPAPFFDSFEQVASDEAITREHVAYLAEQQELWQYECSPRASTMAPAAFEAAVVRAAEGDVRDFLGWSLAMRWSFVRSTALLALPSLPGRSPSGSPSAPKSTSPASPPGSPAAAPSRPSGASAVNGAGSLPRRGRTRHKAV